METQYVVTFIQPKNKFDKPLNILFPIDWGQEEKVNPFFILHCDAGAGPYFIFPIWHGIKLCYGH